MKKAALPFGIVTLLGTAIACAQSQSYFECKDAAGKIMFSDRPCAEAGKVVPIKLSQDPSTPEGKAASDARIQRDRTLADQLQSNRVAKDHAAYGRQDQQVQAAKAISGKLDQERSQQQSTTNSVLPASQSLATTPSTR